MEGGFQYVLRGTVLTVIAILVATGVIAVLSGALARVFSISQETRDRFPDIEHRVNRYLPILYGGIRVAVFLVAVGAIAEAWGIGVAEALASDSGRAFLGAVATPSWWCWWSVSYCGNWPRRPSNVI